MLYAIQSTQIDIAARAEAIALEQSVELPRAAVRDSYIVSHIMGHMEKIEAAEDGLYHVTILFPVEITDYEHAQFLNVLFGNTSLQGSGAQRLWRMCGAVASGKE